MYLIDECTRAIFFNFLDRNISINEFEKWIYDNYSKLEIQIEPTMLYELVSFDYRQSHNINMLDDYINKILQPNEFEIWRIKNLLIDIIENRIDIVLGTNLLSHLYDESDGLMMPVSLGVYYSSELDDVPFASMYHLWNDKWLAEKLNKVELYRENIINDCKDYLKILNDIEAVRKSRYENRQQVI